MKDQSSKRFLCGIATTLGAAILSIAFGEIGINLFYWAGPGYGDEAMKGIVYAATLLIPVVFYVIHFMRVKKFCHDNPGSPKEKKTIASTLSSAISLAVVYTTIPTVSSTLLFSSNFSEFIWFFVPAWILTSLASFVSYMMFGYRG